MRDFQSIADRFEIEAISGEFTDAVMMHDYDRLASLFTEGGVVCIPDIDAEVVNRTEIRAEVERLQEYKKRYADPEGAYLIFSKKVTATEFLKAVYFQDKETLVSFGE